MRDSFGRDIDYLRISVTDRCNLRCCYCMPENGVEPLEHGDILSYEELLRLTGLLASLGIRTHVGHAASQIDGADAVVTSTAVQAENPEVVAARARRIPVVPRALMLAELMRLKQGVAIGFNRRFIQIRQSFDS